MQECFARLNSVSARTIEKRVLGAISVGTPEVHKIY